MNPTQPVIATELGDSCVDEVRAIREAIDAAVGHDVGRLAEQSRAAAEKVRREFGLTAAPPIAQPTDVVAAP